MGHRTARTSLTHKLKSKRSARIGVLILIGGMLALITEAQFEPLQPWNQRWRNPSSLWCWRSIAK